MKLIQTNGNKTFKIIPRQFVVGVLTLNLRSESTTLIENDFFTLEVLNGSDVIYKDKVFCTDQTINQSNNDYYTINKNQFVSEDSFDNDYIII